MAKITVTLTDGSVASIDKFALRDNIAFERQYGCSVAVLESAPRLEHIAWITHHALVRTGQVDADFEAWLDGVELFHLGSSEEQETDAAAGPTEPGAPTA